MTERFIPYARHEVDDADIAAVAEVLRGDWLTTGPSVARFESAFAEKLGVKHAVAVSNGTAALHVAMLAAELPSDAEVIVPALTFAASANCARYVGAKVVFADVLESSLNVDPSHVASLITPRTRAIVGVDYAGLPCDLDAMRELANTHDLWFVEDACHALGARHRGRPIGGHASAATFSFHPVKHITSGEGGVVTTDDDTTAARLRTFRNHGITSDHRQRELQGTWEYDMVALGFNYRLTDLQCALGLSQLGKLDKSLSRRRTLARQYGAALQDDSRLKLPAVGVGDDHAWHLYPVRIEGPDAARLRAAVYARLRSRGIGVNVHYRPVYLHSYYRDLGYPPGLCPEAERAYAGLLSLPMWPGLTDGEHTRVVGELRGALDDFA